MLPFNVSPAAGTPTRPSFTIGQRLRPNGGRNSFAALKKRAAHAAYSTQSGARGTLSRLCTRKRVIGTVLLLVVGLLALATLPLFSHGKPETPFTQLQEQIKATTLLNEDGTSEIDAGLSAQQAAAQARSEETAQLRADSQLQSLSAQRVALMEAELLAQQAANAKLRLELEAAKAAAAAAPAAPAPVASNAVALRPTSSLPMEVPSYPPIAVSASRQYSKFHCIGGRGRLGKSAQSDRACRFQNICYKPSTNRWQFFADPREQLVVLLDQGRIISEFPEQFLNLRSMGNPEDAKWWSPELVMSEDGIPPSAFVPREDPAKPTVNVLYHPHYPSNMGHVIGDDLFPIFNLMSSFGMLVDDAQLIISRDCGKIFANSPKKAQSCDFFLKMLIPGLSRREYLAATAPDFASRLRSGGDDLVCFDQLLVGLGPWGFQQSLGKAPAWWSYHAFYLHNLGINPNRTPKRHRITVSIKKGKRALANNDELVAHLKDKFPEYEIDALELRSLGGWQNELNYLLDTSVLITPCGGVSMSAMFLPHNAALVVVDYFNTKKNVSFGMEERLWSNLGFVRPFHYPFTKDEVRMPEGKSYDSYQDMRDWGEVRVNLPRMETIVRAAISHVDNFMVFGQQ